MGRAEKGLRHQYDFFLKYFDQTAEFTDPAHALGFTAQLPHMAYHLGAIRQILKVV